MTDEARTPCPGKWQDVESPLPWVVSFNQHIRGVDLPRFTNKEIVFATDSSGHHRESPYEVVGIVAFDLHASGGWEATHRQLRKTILNDGRRMSFKKLNEPMRIRALTPFLEAADQIEGLCLCVGIKKGIDSLGGGAQMLDQLFRGGVLKASWSLSSFERMSRTAHFISLLIAGLCSPGQNITWISDEDEMFESSCKSEDTRRVLSAFSSMYVKWKAGRCGIGTTKLDEGDRFEEDITAVADLAAGCMNEALTKAHQETAGVLHHPIRPRLSDRLSEKASFLVSWFADNSHSLKRISLAFDRRSDGKFRLCQIDLGA